MCSFRINNKNEQNKIHPKLEQTKSVGEKKILTENMYNMQMQYMYLLENVTSKFKSINCWCLLFCGKQKKYWLLLTEQPASL